MTFPQIWEKFSEWYSNEVDLLRKDIIATDNLYDPQTDTIRFRGYTVSVKKAECYCSPPELVEFCKTTNPIIKPHAYKITVEIKYFVNLYGAYWGQDVEINYMDWLGFLHDNAGGYIYINCNPQSPHYGNIIVVNRGSNHTRIVYKSIQELTSDICQWMTATGELRHFDIDEFLDRNHAYRGNNPLTGREILTSDNPVVRGWATNVNWEFKAKLLYKDPKHYNFSHWVWDKHAKN
jgi:hypothetical protein